jgi:hypothetical protein
MKNTCPNCGHSLTDNNHGPDQNDFEYDFENDTLIHRGSCTYCKECQRLAAELNSSKDINKC